MSLEDRYEIVKEKPMTDKPHIDIDDCVNRYIAAIDEIYYVAEQLAAHMCIMGHYDSAKDYLNGLISRVEDMPLDLENIRDDADGGDV